MTQDVDWKDDLTFATCSTDKAIHTCIVGENYPRQTFSGDRLFEWFQICSRCLAGKGHRQARGRAKVSTTDADFLVRPRHGFMRKSFGGFSRGRVGLTCSAVT